MKKHDNSGTMTICWIMILGLLFNIVSASITGQVSIFTYNCANTIGIIQSLMVIILLMEDNFK